MAGLFRNARRGQFSNDVRLSTRPGRTRTGAARRSSRGEASPAFPRLAGSGMEPLEARLLMSAVRTDAAFTTSNLGVGDDRSTTTAQSLGFLSPINFFGSQYSGVFVNNNGNVTFGARNSTFVNAGLDSIAAKMFAPFYADVDTMYSGGTVRYGRGTVDGHKAFGVNWVDVDFYEGGLAHSNHNSFQLVLIDRSDLGAGSFDVEFNYDHILWESGANENGINGMGGDAGRVGFTSGDGDPLGLYQMPGSGVAGSFLDGNSFTGLALHSFNSDVTGRYVYHFREGTWADAPATSNAAPVVALPGTLALALSVTLVPQAYADPTYPGADDVRLDLLAPACGARHAPGELQQIDVSHRRCRPR